MIKQFSAFVDKWFFVNFLQTRRYLLALYFYFHSFDNCANCRFVSMKFPAKEIFLPNDINRLLGSSFPEFVGIVAGKYYFLLLTSPYDRSISTLRLKWILFRNSATNSARTHTLNNLFSSRETSQFERSIRNEPFSSAQFFVRVAGSNLPCTQWNFRSILTNRTQV